MPALVLSARADDALRERLLEELAQEGHVAVTHPAHQLAVRRFGRSLGVGGGGGHGGGPGAHAARNYRGSGGRLPRKTRAPGCTTSRKLMREVAAEPEPRRREV